VLLVAFYLPPAVAQVADPGGRCNNEFARFLVEQQVADSRSVEETDKRIRILTRSADFIWKFDQPKAREYLSEAFKVANERFNEKGFEKRNEKGLIIHAPDYRFEVVRSIAKKDADWAKRLLEQILKDYEKTAADRAELDKTREIDSILQIAVASVKTNPGLSWHLFRRLMRSPLDTYWFFGLAQTAAEDRQFADQLYGELLKAYADQTPRRLLFLSAYPFAGGRILGIDKYSYGVSVPEGLTPNLNLQQQFISMFLQRASRYAGDPESISRPRETTHFAEPLYLVTALQELEPVVVERFPALLQRFSEARARAVGLLSDDMRKEMRDKEKRNANLGYSFDERLAEVEKADEEGKLTDFVIVTLLIRDGADRTEEQFRKILPWLEKIRDESVRADTINYFWFLRSHLAVTENRLEDAEKFAAKVPEIEHRAILLFETAESRLKEISETSDSLQILAEVGKVARQSDDSVAKARVLLGLASVYEKVNHIFALDELSDAIKVINKLEKPNLLSSSVHRQISGKDFSFFTVFNMPGYDLESTFKLISKNDFEMSLSNAKALEDKYFRTLAVLAVAQNCVERPKSPRGQK
jgi:hypothetical protein